MILTALALAATLGLPECVQPSGEKITAADLAAVVPEFRKLPPELVFGYSPRPGVSRFLTPPELTHWLSQHGQDAEIREQVCFQWTLQKLNLEEAASVMLQS